MCITTVPYEQLLVEMLSVFATICNLVQCLQPLEIPVLLFGSCIICKIITRSQ